MNLNKFWTASTQYIERQQKNSAELKKCSNDLDQQFKKVGKVFTIRWLASTFKTVNAIMECYGALSKHLNRKI